MTRQMTRNSMTHVDSACFTQCVLIKCESCEYLDSAAINYNNSKTAILVFFDIYTFASKDTAILFDIPTHGHTNFYIYHIAN